jgi:hypothetical protein
MERPRPAPCDMPDIKWVYLTTAPNEWTAEMWKNLLSSEGIRVILRPGDVSSFLGSSPLPVRLMVDEKHKLKALEVLSEQTVYTEEEQPPS